jgi:hypothetical protein
MKMRIIPARLALVAAVVAIALVALQPPAADAAAGKSVSFSKSWTFKAAPDRVCVVFTVSGKITYTAVSGPRGVVEWRNQRLTNPTLVASVHSYDRGSCAGRSTLTRLSMTQLWSGWSCSFNPSVSASLPWGLSFGGWPSCGNRNRARHGTSYGASSVYEQFNSGSPTGFGSYTGFPPSIPCYGVFVTATIYQHNVSDSFSSGAREVCLPAA